jgi:peptidoglycan/LPS O-acetylase OafA/YrhL
MSWLQQTFEISHHNHKTIHALEGLRGVAVFLVFLVHYCGQIMPWLAINSFSFQTAKFLNEIGNIGVDLFFVLSGYLIYGTLIKKQTGFAKHMRRRARRIYPTFLVVLAIYLLLSIVLPGENKFPGGLLNQIVYLAQNILLLPGIFDIQPIITVSWSLSYELFYYLLIPLVIGVFSLRERNWKMRTLFFLLISLAGFVYFYFYSGHVRLLMFLAGIVLFEISTFGKFKMPRFSGLAAFSAALAATALMFSFRLSEVWLYLTLYVLFLLFVLESLSQPKGTARLLSFTPLRWLGNISYSYYLIHGLTLKAAFLLLYLVFPPTNANSELLWLLCAPMFAATFVVSALLFVFVEKPFSLIAPPRPVETVTETRAGVTAVPKTV